MNALPGPPLGQGWQRQLAAVLGVLIIGTCLAIGAVALLKSFGVGPQLQRVAAFACVAAPLLTLAVLRGIGPQDALSTAAVLVGICAVVVTALTYVGSVDKDPGRGCINTNGQLRATVSGTISVVYSGATAASEPKGLLLRGCEVRGVGWCVGAVHEDAVEAKVFDRRWLILSGDQGLVPVGRTVGQTLPDEERDDNCRDGVPPPDEITVPDARLDQRTGSIAVSAQAERAAFIGFAIRRSQDRWQRIGWDYATSGEVPVVLPAPQPPARLGDEVIAVACVGYQQAAISEGSAVSQTSPLKRGPSMTPDKNRVAATQPTAREPEAAACSSSIPTPPAPYGPGTVAAPG